MNEDNIKAAVRTHYADIAMNGSSCCSKSGDCCSTSDLIQIGEGSIIGEADLGLGCGMPTQYAGIRAGDTILDLGSGAGVDVFRAAEAAGPDGYVIGVDMTPEMIERAKANAEKGGYRNVEFRLGDIENLPVDDDSIDWVLSNCVINLILDKKRVFEEVYRVLKPGGRVSISDIVTTGEVPIDIRQDMSLWAGCVSGAIDRDAYLNLLKECGFGDINIRQLIEYDENQDDGYAFASMTFEAEKI